MRFIRELSTCLKTGKQKVVMKIILKRDVSIAAAIIGNKITSINLENGYKYLSVMLDENGGIEYATLSHLEPGKQIVYGVDDDYASNIINSIDTLLANVTEEINEDVITKKVKTRLERIFFSIERGINNEDNESISYRKCS